MVSPRSWLRTQPRGIKNMISSSVLVIPNVAVVDTAIVAYFDNLVLKKLLNFKFHV